MGFVNNSGDLPQMFLDIDTRLRRVESAKAFNFPYLSSAPALPVNGDAWVRSDNSTIYVQIAGTAVALTTGASVTTLAGLSDVNLTSPTNNQVLTYNTASSKWINAGAVNSAVAGTGIGVSASTGAVTISNTGVTAFTSGTGLSTNTSATGSVSVTNTGVTSNVAGGGISVSSATGAVTVTNTGVTSLTTSSGLSTNTSATGAVSVTNTGVTSLTTSSGLSTNTSATGAVSVTNTGVTSLVAGTNITLSGSTGAVTINASSGGASVPSGTITMYGGATAPTDWLLCNGGAVSRTTYSALFTAISTTFGVGDGSTTFNLPDMRSRMPIGVGTGSGLTARTLAGTGGVESVTLTSAQSGVPAHSHANTAAFTGTAGSHNHTQDAHGHSVSDPTHSHAIYGSLAYSASSGTLIGTSGTAFNLSWSTQAAATGVTVVANTATNQSTSVTPAGTVAMTNANNTAANAASSHDNMSPYLGVNFIIKT